MPNTKHDSKSVEAALARLVPEIARILGYEVVKKDHDRAYPHYFEIRDPNSDIHLGLWAGYDSGYGKIEITGRFNDRDAAGNIVWHLPYNTPTPKIGVSVDKTASTIARDIVNRLLPNYRPLLAKCKASRESYDTHNTGVARTVARLSTLVGSDPSRARDGRVDLYRSKGLPEESGDVVVSAPDSVRLDIGLTADEAEQLLIALMAFRAKK